MDVVQRIPVRSRADVEAARRTARALATTIGFRAVDAERIVLAVSELAMNQLRYAYDGDLLLAPATAGNTTGIRVESRDAGPGIADLDAALRDGVSTACGLGSGLPSVRRLMDEMTIATGAQGTTVVAYKWLSGH